MTPPRTISRDFSAAQISGAQEKTRNLERLTLPAAIIKIYAQWIPLSATSYLIALPDSDGKEIRLGSLWAGQAAILVFLRHYG